ncbi:MAG: bifunctional precorrin-2 dehydrogenase/sirohydrochlorin ferrochelatase [Thermodesulfatator sp.]|nr:MAG: bifunctional precorrin-2 dehydrogenase/sirohydrochlorin ferrochelatase [Thermodesulfatator sp.]
MKNAHQNHSYLPIFCDIRGKSVVVIGGGRVAERKIKNLLDAGARVTVISPETTSNLSDMIRQGLVNHRCRNYVPGDLDGAWLVIAATDDKKVQDAVFQESQERQIFCNVVDEPRVCSFIVPSTVRRNELCFAVSTGGKSPALAKALRKRLERQFGPEWGTFVSLLGRLRNIIIAENKGDSIAEKCSLLADLQVPVWIENSDWESVARWAENICGPKATSIIQEFSGNG